MNTVTRTIGLSVCLALSGVAFAGGDITAGQQKAVLCGSCHGMNGLGMGNNPPLAGMVPERMTELLQQYQSGQLVNPMMNQMVGGLSAEDMANLAAYYESLPKPQ